MTLSMASNRAIDDAPPPPLPARNHAPVGGTAPPPSRPIARRGESKSFAHRQRAAQPVPERTSQLGSTNKVTERPPPRVPIHHSTSLQDCFEPPSFSPAPPPLPDRTRRNPPPVPDETTPPPPPSAPPPSRARSLDGGNTVNGMNSPAPVDKEDLENRFRFHDILDLPPPEKFLNKRHKQIQRAAQRKAQAALGSL